MSVTKGATCRSLCSIFFLLSTPFDKLPSLWLRRITYCTAPCNWLQQIIITVEKMNAEALIVKTSSTVTANIIEEDFTNTSAETFWVSRLKTKKVIFKSWKGSFLMLLLWYVHKNLDWTIFYFGCLCGREPLKHE